MQAYRRQITETSTSPMGLPSISDQSVTPKKFPSESVFQQSLKSSISTGNITLPPRTPDWASFQIHDAANEAGLPAQKASSAIEPSTSGLGSSINFASSAILPNYNDSILTPKESEVDREEATIDLNNASRLLSYVLW